jgi:hypothetical protein
MEHGTCVRCISLYTMSGLPKILQSLEVLKMLEFWMLATENFSSTY